MDLAIAKDEHVLKVTIDGAGAKIDVPVNDLLDFSGRLLEAENALPAEERNMPALWSMVYKDCLVPMGFPAGLPDHQARYIAALVNDGAAAHWGALQKKHFAAFAPSVPRPGSISGVESGGSGS